MNTLMSSCESLVEQSLWTLGNIIGDNIEFRDLIIEFEMIEVLVNMKFADKSLSFVRTLIWVMVNLVRSKDFQISIENVKKLIPKINGILLNVDDAITRIDALWALTYIADCNELYIQPIVDSGIIAHVVPLLSSHRYRIMLAAMRMLGNIATGSDSQTDVLIQNDILIHIRFPLMHHKENLRRMALWSLSNITVGTQEQVQAVFMSGLLLRIVENLTMPDIRTRKEALFCLNNMISSGSKEQALLIINQGTVQPLFTLMQHNDREAALTARTALKTLFQKVEKLVVHYAEIYDQLYRS